jgi:D-arabinose 1-dehydrogenase-like Zn-dependent alcohol dehydrogenase
MNSVQGGLATNGTLLVIGAVDRVAVDALQLLRGRRSIKGWYSGTSIDSQETLAFSALTGVRSMNEILPLERAAEGYERMISGRARFRVVLTTGN